MQAFPFERSHREQRYVFQRKKGFLKAFQIKVQLLHANAELLTELRRRLKTPPIVRIQMKRKSKRRESACEKPGNSKNAIRFEGIVCM